jgi:hypothetical protein
MVERDIADTPNTHDRSLPWLCTGTSITMVGVNLLLWTQDSPLSEMTHTSFPS